MRHCGNCGKTGHYAKTCSIKVISETPTALPNYEGSLKTPAWLSFAVKTEDSDPERCHSCFLDRLHGYPDHQKQIKDYKDFPNIFKATRRGLLPIKTEINTWKRIAELRTQGKIGEAYKLANGLFGIEETDNENADTSGR